MNIGCASFENAGVMAGRVDSVVQTVLHYSIFRNVCNVSF